MKILVIRAGAIGDVIMATGVVRQLAMENNTKIDVATDCPLVFDNNVWVGKVDRRAAFNVDDYDKVVDLDLAYERIPNQHTIKSYADVAGVDTTNLKIELAKKTVGNLPNNYVVLHMRRHFWPNRNLPEDFWIQLIGLIIGSTDLNVVQIGGENDYQFNGIPGRLYNLVNKVDIGESVSVIDHARAFVGVDSSNLHIAAATETPIVGLFTSVRAEYREPLYRTAKHINIASDIECYGCVETLPAPVTTYYCKRGDEQCTRSFDPVEVFEKLKTLL